MIRASMALVLFALPVLAQDAVTTLSDGLVGHWTFDGDTLDHSDAGNHGLRQGVDLNAAGRKGTPGTAALFDGIDDVVEVNPSDSLPFGSGAFAVSAWIHTEEKLSDVVGDILSKFGPQSRKGFSLSIKGSSPTYNGHSDVRNVHFGIDNGIDSQWTDRGKLWPSNTYISSLTVFEGDLYAGMADAAAPEDACRVFRYGGGTEWIDCGRVSPSLKTRSVYSMTVHKGALYVGTGQYDWQTVSPANCDVARVYRYKGGTEWEDCGNLGENYRVISLATFNGELYAGTDVTGGAPRGPSTGKVYRYAGGQKWVDCGRLGDQQHVFALVAHNGALYGGTNGEVFRYEGGTEWTYVGRPCGNTQIHCLEVYRGKLYAGTWPDGTVCRYEGGTQWTACGDLGVKTDHYKINEVNALTVYNGMLYGGSIPKAEVYRYNAYDSWDSMGQLVHNPLYAPDVISSWNRIPCLTVFQGQLWAGTSTCRGNVYEDPLPEVGRVYSMYTGSAVSYDYDLGPGWKHIVAMRSNAVNLYIDGKLVAEGQPFSYSELFDLTNDEPLTIGFGPTDYFTGTMDDLRLYNRGLSDAEVQALFAE